MKWKSGAQVHSGHQTHKENKNREKESSGEFLRPLASFSIVTRTIMQTCSMRHRISKDKRCQKSVFLSPYARTFPFRFAHFHNCLVSPSTLFLQFTPFHLYFYCNGTPSSSRGLRQLLSVS